jgi:hypothetical protein
MNPSDEAMRAYLREIQRIELTERSSRRLSMASGVTAGALLAVAEGSLFDTEPSSLRGVLDELTGEER